MILFIFSWEPALWTQTSQERVLRMRRSKIDHSNFRLQQRILSIEMKTKLVQHVEREWMRDWKSVRVRKSESEIARESDYKYSLLSLHMKTKVVQNVQTFIHSWFPAFVWHSDIFIPWRPIRRHKTMITVIISKIFFLMKKKLKKW